MIQNTFQQGLTNKTNTETNKRTNKLKTLEQINCIKTFHNNNNTHFCDKFTLLKYLYLRTTIKYTFVGFFGEALCEKWHWPYKDSVASAQAD